MSEIEAASLAHAHDLALTLSVAYGLAQNALRGVPITSGNLARARYAGTNQFSDRPLLWDNGYESGGAYFVEGLDGHTIDGVPLADILLVASLRPFLEAGPLASVPPPNASDDVATLRSVRALVNASNARKGRPDLPLQAQGHVQAALGRRSPQVK